MVTSYSIKLAYFVSMVAFAGVLFGYYVYRLGVADVQSSKIWMLFIIGGAILGAFVANRTIPKVVKQLEKARQELEQEQAKES